MPGEIESLKARIATLQKEHDNFLRTHQTLMDIYKTKGTQEAKNRASRALDEAGKHADRIAELKAELAAVESG